MYYIFKRKHDNRFFYIFIIWLNRVLPNVDVLYNLCLTFEMVICGWHEWKTSTTLDRSSDILSSCYVVT